ncbi:hypothetical protein NDU88_003278 [Pleurodeles waltl]|uniref:Uncharacterized protein n=1 Tax=Pleurodeles waltl TaxID=8319 RepID=A0AAV7W1P2_PLEWA|nr:hypothetical protein NDU88_003278 [Pleurodeles waltl]
MDPDTSPYLGPPGRSPQQPAPPGSRRQPQVALPMRSETGGRSVEPSSGSCVRLERSGLPRRRRPLSPSRGGELGPWTLCTQRGRSVAGQQRGQVRAPEGLVGTGGGPRTFALRGLRK